MKKDNNKIKKIGAWIAIIILLLACCMPMIFAFGNGEDSQAYFKASLAVAIMVPIMAYAIWMVYKLLNRNKKVVDSDMENIIFDVGHIVVKNRGIVGHPDTLCHRSRRGDTGADHSPGAHQDVYMGGSAAGSPGRSALNRRWDP